MPSLEWCASVIRRKMPKIKGWTPAWLDKPAPGSKLFAPSKDDQKSSAFSSKARSKPGPTRTIARSGSQVFVAVGKEVRWADLIDLKERWQEKTSRGRTGVRIKRESSGGVQDDEILQAAAGEDYAGFRVCLMRDYAVYSLANLYPRPSTSLSGPTSSSL